MFDKPALLLNADYRPMNYFPLSTVPWQTAVKLRYEDIVDVVAEYDDVIRSPSTEMRAPSVVALKRYVPQSQHVAFTRFNVFLRDGFKCQYCGQKHAVSDLTFDHVLPRAKGGATCWENIVAACESCNAAKDDKHLMKPLRWPYRPTPHQLLAAQRKFPPNYLHESWVDYLYWDSEISA